VVNSDYGGTHHLAKETHAGLKSLFSCMAIHTEVDRVCCECVFPRIVCIWPSSTHIVE